MTIGGAAEFAQAVGIFGVVCGLLFAVAGWVFVLNRERFHIIRQVNLQRQGRNADLFPNSPAQFRAAGVLLAVVGLIFIACGVAIGASAFILLNFQ